MNWLVQLFEYLTCWVPRLYFVNPDEAGIRITLGKYTKDIEPGWYVEWPLIHGFYVMNTAINGVKFAIQSVTTADNIDLAIRGAVLYRVTNAHKAILETNNFDNALEAVASGVIETFIAEKTYDELQDRKDIKGEVMKGLRDEANGWGIKLLKVYIPDIGRVRNIRVLGDSVDNPQIIPDTE